jgi:hypothetical protein
MALQLWRCSERANRHTSANVLLLEKLIVERSKRALPRGEFPQRLSHWGCDSPSPSCVSRMVWDLFGAMGSCRRCGGKFRSVHRRSWKLVMIRRIRQPLSQQETSLKNHLNKTSLFDELFEVRQIAAVPLGSFAVTFMKACIFNRLQIFGRDSVGG